MEEKGNGELAFHDTLLKKSNTEILLIYNKPTHAADVDICISAGVVITYIKTFTTKQSVRIVLLPPYLNDVTTNKDDLKKENTRIKQVLNENGYQESITRKMCLE